MSIVIWLAIVAFAGYFLVRKFRHVDERLQADRAQREARMLAAALAWKNTSAPVKAGVQQSEDASGKIK